jgi:threonine dehydrogenase-like Zn-dependent dehydrogenase
MELELRPTVDPVVGEVVLAVIATGICGSDVHGLTGDTGRRSDGQVMGHETVGRVIEVGDTVDPRWIGKLATVIPLFGCGSCVSCRSGHEQQCPDLWVLGVRPDVDGAFSSRLVVSKRNLVELPSSMTQWHGAVIEPLAVGFHAAKRGSVGPSDRVLIIGAGPIGQAAALAAHRLGARSIFVSEPDANRSESVQALGFACAHPDELADWSSKWDGGATVVIDAVGTSSTLQSALELSAPGARVVLVGMAAPRLDMAAYELSAKERTVIGTFCYSHNHFKQTAMWASEHPEILEKLVDRFAPLHAGSEVFASIIDGSLLANKVLLMPESADV